MDVVIAGGGIAGLTMALTCHQIGVSAHVVEAVDVVRPLGLGINLQPSAVRELYDLGLERELAEISVPITEVALIARNGTEVWVEPRGHEAGCRWPQLSVHRGELQMMLHRAVVERLGTGAVRTGHAVTGYEHTAGGAAAHVAATDGSERVEGAVLLAADGLHSAVRAQMFPGEGSPRWGGAVLWRGSTPFPSVRGGSSFVVVGNTAQRFVTFPIGAADPDTGMQAQNWIAEQTFDVRLGWRRGDWNTRVQVEEFIAHFDDWGFDWLDVPALLRGSEQIFEYPMVDRDPVSHWVHGRVALLGDAAHPMYPVGSNGASQAILDARVLGAALVEHGVGAAALQAYEATLIEQRSELVIRSRTAGPGSVLGAVDERSASIVADLDAVDPAAVARLVADHRRAERVAIDALNTAPSTISTRSA